LLGLYGQAQMAEWLWTNADGRQYRICDGDFDCVFKTLDKSKSFESRPTTQTGSVAPLVKLALSSRDPNAIAAAIYACGYAGGDACGAISLADWAAVEPDNAAVWLKLADATLGKDDVARDAALRRAALASGYDMRAPSLIGLMDADLVKAQTPLLQFAIGNAIGVSNYMSGMAPAYALMGYCLHDKKPDAGRNALCDTLANKLLANDDSLIGLSTATAIGKKIGWDAARLQALRDERAAVYGPIIEASSTEKMYSCESVEKNNRLVRQMLSAGERTTARERMTKNGETIKEAAAKYRKLYPESVK
jgi:hypothetical protein